MLNLMLISSIGEWHQLSLATSTSFRILLRRFTRVHTHAVLHLHQREAPESILYVHQCAALDVHQIYSYWCTIYAALCFHQNCTTECKYEVICVE